MATNLNTRLSEAIHQRFKTATPAHGAVAELELRANALASKTRQGF